MRSIRLPVFPLSHAFLLALFLVLCSCTFTLHNPLQAVADAPSTNTAKRAAPAVTPSTGPIATTATTAAPAPPPGPSDPKKYDTVITKDAKTSRGMLLYHKVKDKHYFEIPEKLLGRDLFWSAEVAQASGDIAFNGLPLGSKVLRFERVENRVLLRAVSYRKRGSEELKAATEAVDLAPIVMTFAVEADGNERSLELRADEKAKPEKTETPDVSEKKPDSTVPEKKIEKLPPAKEKWPVIDASRLLLTTSNDLVNARAAGPMGLGAPDPSRSLVNQVKVFAANVEMRSTMTFSSAPPFSAIPGVAPTPSVAINPSRSAVLHFSLAMLPETPMPGRYFDPRVGFFAEGFQEYGGARSGVRDRQFITRYRLEKKEPAAEVSPVLKPITFYLAPEVPEKWRKYMKQGIEDWQSAFTKAGFANAIVVLDPPSKKDDPDWDPEDARYSVIRWVAQPVANAMGPSVYDPRSGEVISAHIIFWHDIVRYMEQLYFIQSGTADSRVQGLPLSDEVMGEMLRYLTTHEVGHALGLRHNHRASTTYTVAQLRDPAFTDAHGTVASIMSYGRFNSVAQPGDGVKSFVPKLGPYDDFAIEWGYKPLGKSKPEEEIADLDRLAAKQIDDPLIRFGGEDVVAFFDTDVLTENIGRERIAATKLSLASLERAAAKLIPATTRLGEDYTVLQQTYGLLIGQRQSFLDSVVKQIGGVRETRFMGGRGGDSIERTPKPLQQAAIRYLLDDALTTPAWLAKPELLNRIRVFDIAGPVIASQQFLLASMLSPVRFRLLEDAEIAAPGSSLAANQYLALIQRGVFRELRVAHPVVDVIRRDLQKRYLELLTGFSGEVQRITNASAMMAFAFSSLSIDLRPAAIEALRDLQRDIRNAKPRVSDAPTRLHLAQLDREIEQILKIRGS